MKCFKQMIALTITIYEIQVASTHKSAIQRGINTIAFKGPQVWQNIPLEIGNSESHSFFKSNVKQIQSLPCRCKICRSFIANLRYID